MWRQRARAEGDAQPMTRAQRDRWMHAVAQRQRDSQRDGEADQVAQSAWRSGGRLATVSGSSSCDRHGQPRAGCLGTLQRCAAGADWGSLPQKIIARQWIAGSLWASMLAVVTMGSASRALPLGRTRASVVCGCGTDCRISAIRHGSAAFSSEACWFGRGQFCRYTLACDIRIYMLLAGRSTQPAKHMTAARLVAMACDT